jgi:colicin import membrane protein
MARSARDVIKAAKAKADEYEARQVAATDAALFIHPNPIAILGEPSEFEAFIAKIKGEIAAFVPDTSTKKGRDAIASLAYKVARTKTFLDDAGKKLTEEKRAEIAKVDEARRKARDRLDAIKDEVRKPLTDWEVAEDRRQKRVEQELKLLRDHATITITETAKAVAERLKAVQLFTIDPAVFAERFAEAEAAKAATLEALASGHDRLVREEGERAELLRLREAERQRALAEEAARREAAEAELRKAEDARREAFAAQQAETQRLRQEAAANAARIAEEEAAAKREANKRHRRKIIKETSEVIFGFCGLNSKADAEAVAEAIADGRIPHVKMEF